VSSAVLSFSECGERERQVSDDAQQIGPRKIERGLRVTLLDRLQNTRISASNKRLSMVIVFAPASNVVGSGRCSGVTFIAISREME
jgi:hypothetical protein